MMKELIKPQNWLVKVEVKDAYFLIPIHHNNQECLILMAPSDLPVLLPAIQPVMKIDMAFLRASGMRMTVSG